MAESASATDPLLRFFELLAWDLKSLLSRQVHHRQITRRRQVSTEMSASVQRSGRCDVNWRVQRNALIEPITCPRRRFNLKLGGNSLFGRMRLRNCSVPGQIEAGIRNLEVSR